MDTHTEMEPQELVGPLSATDTMLEIHTINTDPRATTEVSASVKVRPTIYLDSTEANLSVLREQILSNIEGDRPSDGKVVYAYVEPGDTLVSRISELVNDWDTKTGIEHNYSIVVWQDVDWSGMPEDLKEVHGKVETPPVSPVVQWMREMEAATAAAQEDQAAKQYTDNDR